MDDPKRRRVPSEVVRFGFAGALAIVVLGGLVLVGVSRVSTAEALRSARDRARLAGFGVIEPVLRSSSQLDVAALDAIVHERVLSDRVVRVKIWALDGTVKYSDEPQLVGRKFAAKLDHQEAVRTGEILSEIADTNGPENEFERGSGRLLEVYMPLRTADGTQLIFEQYERYDSVVGNARALLKQLAIPFGAALALLWLVQLPLAAALSRRARRAEAERTKLLEKAYTASARERERIAADLHDGVVQSLAGLTFDLEASARSQTDEATRHALERSAETARSGMQKLRSALLDLNPVRAHDLGVHGVMDQLTRDLRSAGTDVELRVSGAVDALSEDEQSLVYRVAQELLRNVESHANASNVDVELSADPRVVRLTVRDNGAGFDAHTRQTRRAEGHVGLELQTALVERAGGSLETTSSIGSGTIAVMELPR